MDIDILVQDMGNTLLNLGATKVEIIEIEEKSKIAKRLIICTSPNNQLAKNIAYDIKEHYKKDLECLHTDGIFKGDWIVLDYKDIIVHIFTKETRSKFNIEKLYKDSKNSITLIAKK